MDNVIIRISVNFCRHIQYYTIYYIYYIYYILALITIGQKEMMEYEADYLGWKLKIYNKGVIFDYKK